MFEPRFTITNKINSALLDIERARGFLDAAKLKESWIKEMQSRALILEAHHSTHIEGTKLTLLQSERILTGKTVEGVRPDDRQELLNYRAAMDFVSGHLDRKSEITEELIKEIHAILVKDVRGGTLEPGNYRKIQNYVVNSMTGEVVYTPPPPEQVPTLMKEFVEWLNSEKEISPVLIAGIAQYKFVEIHPFLDGNGRTARLLCTLILYQNGYDFKRLFSLSEFYDKDRKEYYRALQSVRENGGDMTEWLEYFVNGLKNQMLEVKAKGELAIKKEAVIEKATRAGLNDRQVGVLVYLLENPYINRSKYVKLYKVSLRTANYDLAYLEKLGFVERVGVGRAIKYRLAGGG
ncbi:MAG: Fic family protein [Candidatus Hadarchaeales archaeon]